MVCVTWRVARGSCLAKEVAILAENMTSASVLLAGKQDGHQRTNTKDPYAAATKIEKRQKSGCGIDNSWNDFVLFSSKLFIFSHQGEGHGTRNESQSSIHVR